MIFNKFDPSDRVTGFIEIAIKNTTAANCMVIGIISAPCPTIAAAEIPIFI